jgi:hypothetical protein
MHGIIVNLPSDPSSESEASDEILYEQKPVSCDRATIRAHTTHTHSQMSFDSTTSQYSHLCAK